jgi:transposase
MYATIWEVLKVDLNGIKILSDGPLPLIAAVYDQLNIGKKVDELVEWDQKKCFLTPGQATKALVLNILTDRKPLYRIQEFYADKDVEKLIGKGATSAHTNEFCIGRTLDKIYDAGAKKLYSSVALGALDIEKIEVKSIHWDTTSKSFQGQYNTQKKSKEDKGPIEITYGYSKDMRKDLKQMKFGIGVTRDKIPLFADVLSGNTDDKTWNGDVITTLKEWFTFVEPAKVMHIADSALVTKDNLLSINDDTYKFISRLPATFKLEKELRERAVSRPELWSEIGRLTDKDDAATYKIQSFLERLEGKEYRFVVCYSDHLDERKDRSIDKEIEAELKTINEETNEHISKDGYYCEADAKSAADKFIAQVSNKYHLIGYTISQEERDKKRSTRGRPKKSENKEIETFYKVDVQIERNQLMVSKKKDEAGMFVLISNETEGEKLTDIEVLKEYKQQHSVESTFRILKDPYYVDEIFLKKPERIEAFGYVMVIAVLLLNVIERRIRKSLEDETQGIALQGRRVTLTPTGTAILDVFEYVKVLAIPMNNSYQRVIPEGLDENQKRILKLCGVSENIYVSQENDTLAVQA